MKAVKLLLKIVLWTVLTVVLLVVALVATLQWWIGPVAKPSADRYLPTITKTPFRFGRLALNPYSGRLEVGNLYLGNPTNYDDRLAASVGLFILDTDPKTLADDVVHLEELTVSNVTISVSYNDGRMNFVQIQANATGNDPDNDDDNGNGIPDDEEQKDPGFVPPNVIIDKLTLTDVELNFGPINVPLPTIHFRDIGKETGGVALDDLADTIVDHVIHVSPASTNAYHKLRAKALHLDTEAPPPEKHVRRRPRWRRGNFGAGGHDF